MMIGQGRRLDLLEKSPGRGWGWEREYVCRSLGLLAHRGWVYKGVIDGEGMLFWGTLLDTFCMTLNMV